jgi:hypothetical protein
MQLQLLQRHNIKVGVPIEDAGITKQGFPASASPFGLLALGDAEDPGKKNKKKDKKKNERKNKKKK